MSATFRQRLDMTGDTGAGPRRASGGAGAVPPPVRLPRLRVLWRTGATVLLGATTVAFIATLVIFALTYLSDASPAATALGDNATPAAISRLNHLWGLDQPFPAQYLTWLGHALRGNLGVSWFDNTSVVADIGQRLPVDISIAAVALVLAIAIGFPAGIMAGVRQGSWADRAVTASASAAITIPSFWAGIILIAVFAVRLHWFPATGYAGLSQDPLGWLRHVILPGIALSLSVAAMIARQLRGSIVAALAENYVVGARVRSLSPTRIMLAHVLRNAAAPTVAVVGLEIPQLLGGAVITETVFALPGIGQYALEGAQNHDVPVIQGVLLVTVVLVLVSNLGVDLLLAWMRPATRRGAR